MPHWYVSIALPWAYLFRSWDVARCAKDQGNSGLAHSNHSQGGAYILRPRSYRCYIQHFADISKPLNRLTQKNMPFDWSECAHAFLELKSKLTTAPILAYHQFNQVASQFVLQTDASAIGLSAVLEQDGHVIAYASRTLDKAEHYSVIQKECLAAVYAMKQFSHYWVDNSFWLLIMPLCSGCQPKKWKACCVGGH